MRTFLSASALIIAALLLAACDQADAKKAVAPTPAATPAPTTPATQTSAVHAHTKDANSKSAIADCCAVPTTLPANTSAAVAVPPKPEPVVVAATQPAAAPSSHVSPWTEPASRTEFGMDYEMTDQDGKTVSLTRYVGKPTVVSFFFTRCANPQMCPLVTFTMANLQRDLATAGIDDKINCALISYDPIFDSPEKVKSYGTERGFNFKQGAMLAPKPAQFRDFILDWEVVFNVGSDGQINHKLEMMMFDKHGKFVREYYGVIWKNADVIKDLQRLLAEP